MLLKDVHSSGVRCETRREDLSSNTRACLFKACVEWVLVLALKA